MLDCEYFTNRTKVKKLLADYYIHTYTLYIPEVSTPVLQVIYIHLWCRFENTQTKVTYEKFAYEIYHLGNRTRKEPLQSADLVLPRTLHHSDFFIYFYMHRRCLYSTSPRFRSLSGPSPSHFTVYSPCTLRLYLDITSNLPNILFYNSNVQFLSTVPWD